jgi:hypothetical protein
MSREAHKAFGGVRGRSVLVVSWTYGRAGPVLLKVALSNRAVISNHLQFYQ